MTSMETARHLFISAVSSRRSRFSASVARARRFRARIVVASRSFGSRVRSFARATHRSLPRRSRRSSSSGRGKFVRRVWAIARRARRVGRAWRARVCAGWGRARARGSLGIRGGVMVQTYDELWDLMTTRSRRSREGERERTRRVTGDDGVGLLLDERRALGDVDVVAAHASDDKGTGGAHVRGGAISLVLVELETDEENQRRGEEDEVVPS